jgi:hypothetical protein
VAQKLFGQEGVIAVMYIPHTASIFQVPDLSLFEVLTISKNIKECRESRVAAAVHLIKAIHAIQDTCTVPRIQNAFKEGEFGLSAPVEPEGVQFGEFN